MPQPQLPNQPAGYPDIFPGSYTGDQSSVYAGQYGRPGATVQPARRPVFAQTNSGPIILPDNFTPDDVAQYVQSWNDRLKTIDAAIAASEGFEKQKWQAAREDAASALQNAYKIADLQAQTSRYGTDAQRQTAIEQLGEKANEYSQDHRLAEATEYAKYASGPDTLFMMGDFKNAMARTGQGLAPSPYGAQGAPTPRGWQDWSALQGVGSGQTSLPSFVTPTGAPASGGVATQTPSSNSSGGDLSTAQGAAGAGSGSAAAAVDPRIKAAKGIIDAIPPSDGAGHDNNDWAALQAVQSVFSAAKPGSYENLRPGQKTAFSAGLSRLGYYAPDAISDMQRAGVGQGSNVRAA